MMEKPEAGGTAILTNGGVVTLVLQCCLASVGLISNDHRITDYAAPYLLVKAK
jgi:hypothetical protein